MMKKNFKCLLGLTLSAAMVIGMTACGNEPVKESETQVVSKETTAVKESETQQVEEGVTYPLDTDETFTLWSHRLDLHPDCKDYTESPFHMGLIENTGVNIEFLFPTKGQTDKEAYNLMLTEIELPNIILASTSNSELSDFYNDGIIYDLTPYLEEYAPDYWAYLTAPGNEDVYRGAKTSDGKILAFWSARESQWGNVFCGPMIRQDWLDECNLDAPVTLEDWEHVLTVFKDKYNATLGFEASYLTNILFASGTGAMGTGAGNGYYVDDNGELQVVWMQPEWKEYMEVLIRWYDAGLIDQDSVTMDMAACRTKAANNQIGASWGAMSRMTNFINDAKANGSSANWVGVSYPRVAEGEPTSMILWGNILQATGAFITTSCPEEQLITAIKFLNYGYSEEGIMYHNFGTEGVSYTIDEEGNAQWTDVVLNDPQGLGTAVYKYSGASEAPMSIQLTQLVRLRNSEETSAAVDIWMENTNAGKHFVPSITLTDEEKLDYTDKFTAIKTYVNVTLFQSCFCFFSSRIYTV